MMLKDKSRHRLSLISLWQTVFGDEPDFIDLIFKKEYESPVLCFAEIIDGKAVSAFYLIENTLKFENKYYHGYYLYAAATLPEYRKEGLMSVLINEALTYCEKNGADFVSLVPSEESLYSYYSRFGFCKAMYRFVSARASSAQCADRSLETITDSEKILEIRNSLEGNLISFSPSSFGYAADVLAYSGFSFKKLSDEGYLLFSPGDKFAELFSSERSLEKNLLIAGNSLSAVTSPFAPAGFDECECVPFGMLYPINALLKRDWKYTDIYMNIALD